MKNLGDITKISGYNVPTVDVVIGGSPCQDLSIAGKRAGLAGERSGLYMEQIRIIKEMRENDRANGRTGEFIRPRYMVWENVPGAFSSNNGKDFAAVLEEAVRIIEPEAPSVPVPEKGWPTSGCLMGDGWSVAWRVLDAQFWGVPQRRRRIALVADFGGQSAPEILFVRKSVSGDSEPCRAERKGSAGRTESCVGITNREILSGDVTETIRAESHGAIPMVYTQSRAYAICSYASNSMLSDNPHSCIYETDTSRTLDMNCGNPSCNQGGVCILDMSHPCDVIRECGDTSPSLQARMATGGNQVPLVAYGIGNGQADSAVTPSYEVSMALDTMHDAQAIFCFAVDCRNGTENHDVNGTLQSKPNGGQSLNLQNVYRVNKSIRRLTPIECERLQGFPSGWTDIGAWVDSKGKLHKESSDSSRYKALGNSIALPPWKWVLKRLCAQYERDATMASLFDGIGGFPLIWEQLNGRGSCLWASEIDEFPISVTSKRFGEEQ